MKDVLTRAAYPAPVDHDRVKADWTREGFSFGVFRDPPGQEWNDFVHSTDEYVVVAEGCLDMSVGNERVIVEPGDRVAIPKNARHSLKTVSAGGSVWLYGYGDWSRDDG